MAKDSTLCYKDCDKPKMVSYVELLEHVGPLGPNYPYGYFCTNCKKPYCFNVKKVSYP